MRAARSGASHFFYGPGVLQQGIVLPAAMVGFEGCRESRLGVGVDRQARQAGQAGRHTSGGDSGQPTQRCKRLFR